MLIPQIKLLPGEQINLENTQGHLRFVVSTSGKFIRVHMQPADAGHWDTVKNEIRNALNALRTQE